MRRATCTATLLAGAALGLLARSAHAEPATEVTQWGITWQFDGSYEVGTYANGDYWVVGPVTITAIRPDQEQYDFWEFTTAGTQGVVLKWVNGWQVNPTYEQGQGFDETLLDFDASLVPALPYVAQPGDSIVKVVSDTDPSSDPVNFTPPDDRMTRMNRPLTAAVLTVVAEAPADGGATLFRPPYVGTDKPLYSTDDLRTELLPSLAAVDHAPSLADVRTGLERVQLDHKGGPAGAVLRPRLNMASSYQPTNAIRDDGAVLRLMLDDSLADKMPALIALVQYGIDEYHIVLGGQTWPAGYGVEPGHKLPLAFAAVLLDHPGMKDAVSQSRFFRENDDMTLSELGIAIWGSANPYGTDQERSNWDYVIDPPSSNTTTARDPYGYIDDGINQHLYVHGYQLCCLSMPYKGEAIAAHLIPEMREIWNQPEFFQYADRWVDVGQLTQPDPCAPGRGTWEGGAQSGQPCTTAQDDVVDDESVCVVDAEQYGVTYGPDPDRPGCCLLDTDPSDGIGRFPSRHGAHADDGVVEPFRDHPYRSAFVDAMWQAYRPGVGALPPVMSPSPASFEGAVDITLEPSAYSNPLGTAIRYTTDGSDPTDSSALYEAPLRLTESAVVKARAFYATHTPSPVTEGAYTITDDTTPPSIARVVTRRSETTVTVVFDELVEPASATSAANYSIAPGIAVTSAAPGDDGATIILTTTAMLPHETYSLTIAAVRDASGNPIAQGTEVPFEFWDFDPFVGLTGYWSFDAELPAKDLACYHFREDGVVSGASAAEGAVGQGMSFAQSSDAVEIGDGNASFHIDETNAFTIAFWLRVSGHATAEDEIFGRTNEYGPSPFSIRVTDTGQIRTCVGESWLDSTATVTDGTWAHVALTFDGANRVLYVDGVEDSGGSNELDVDLYFPNTRTTKLGNGFIGSIDEVRIYDRALTATEIGYLQSDETEYVACPYLGACVPSSWTPPSGSGGGGAGAGAGAPGAAVESEDDSGCGCATRKQGSSGAVAVAGLVAAVWVLRRRGRGGPSARAGLPAYGSRG